MAPGLTREDGGPSYSVPALAGALVHAGAAVKVRSVGSGPPEPGLEHLTMASHPPAAGLLGRVLRSSPSLKKELAADARGGDVLHTHGLWLMPNVYPARAVQRSNGSASLLHSPRGMLGSEALKISAWKKRLFWWFAQHAAIRRADCLHATATSEYEEMRAAKLDQPV
ncbi:MAG: glycosyltransferase, partial [bacterium]|nr:glycosyltransferase [bacterium]